MATIQDSYCVRSKHSECALHFMGCHSILALEQEAIPHAAIPKCTTHFFLVNTLRESEVDLARSIEGFQLLGGKQEIQTAEIVLELSHFPRSNNRDYWHRLMAQPGERYLRH